MTRTVLDNLDRYMEHTRADLNQDEGLYLTDLQRDQLNAEGRAVNAEYAEKILRAAFPQADIEVNELGEIVGDWEFADTASAEWEAAMSEIALDADHYDELLEKYSKLSDRNARAGIDLEAENERDWARELERQQEIQREIERARERTWRVPYRQLLEPEHVREISLADPDRALFLSGMTDRSDLFGMTDRSDKYGRLYSPTTGQARLAYIARAFGDSAAWEAEDTIAELKASAPVKDGEPNPDRVRAAVARKWLKDRFLQAHQHMQPKAEQWRAAKTEADALDARHAELIVALEQNEARRAELDKQMGRIKF